MPVQDALANMSRAMKDMQMRWVEVRGEWKDDRARQFEEKYVASWERDFRVTVSQIETMSAYLNKVRADCA